MSIAAVRRVRGPEFQGSGFKGSDDRIPKTDDGSRNLGVEWKKFEIIRNSNYAIRDR